MERRTIDMMDDAFRLPIMYSADDEGWRCYRCRPAHGGSEEKI